MIRLKKKIGSFLAILAILAMVACGNNSSKSQSSKVIAVTIPPLQGLVAEIVGADYHIECLLPSGSSPETYSPTARQITALSNAEFIFAVGTMPFEEELTERVKNQQNNIIITSAGIELLTTSCEHHHKEESHAEGKNHSHDHLSTHSHHHHSSDPHVWLAPDELQVIVDNIASEIITAHPDSTKYIANYEQLKAKLEARKLHYAELLKNAPKSFLIYHPALGYLAEDYGLEQISLENEGKSPTPSALANIVDKVESEGLSVVLYQQEYPLDVVKPIAEILGVNVMEINPLSKDIIAELDKIVITLTNSYE